MYFQVQSPPPIWISRAVNPHSREIFQHAFRRGGVDFFWNTLTQYISIHLCSLQVCFPNSDNVIFSKEFALVFSLVMHAYAHA